MTTSANSSKYYGEKKVKSLWEQICDDFTSKRRELEGIEVDDTTSSVDTDVTQYSARRHTPVVYGKMVYQTHIDANVFSDFNPSIGHPAAVGLTMLSKPDPPPSPPPSPPPNPNACSPTEYLESYIFPVLIPAIEAMLKQAKKEKCFERKRSRFNACDFLTEYLYKRNPLKSDPLREECSLWKIPFVESWLSSHPRQPLPLSLQWSEDEAALKIQSFYRGHLVRVQPEVTELREWQREWREESRDIRKKVEQFWEEAESRASSENLNDRGSSRGSGRARSAKSQRSALRASSSLRSPKSTRFSPAPMS